MLSQKVENFHPHSFLGKNNFPDKNFSEIYQNMSNEEFEEFKNSLPSELEIFLENKKFNYAVQGREILNF